MKFVAGCCASRIHLGRAEQVHLGAQSIQLYGSMIQGGPPKIIKLDESVVNRIAAGEVIQRPASALKEMLENSLDAGATKVSITVKDGGLKLMQIQDDGHGIRLEDLPLLCVRHATSKLRKYEDLTGISTLGFRGEALASISFVALCTVTTMLEGNPHGWRVSYRDGVMDAEGPKPCAAVRGTTILVEDLFYNVPTRKRALKSSEEYARILDVVGKYAVYKAGVGFTCKRSGEARSDVHVLPSASRLDNIRSIHGTAVARALSPVRMTVGSGAEPPGPHEDGPCFNMQGYVSGADYAGKKSIMMLFINGRPVDCTPLKRALEAAYASVLPKAVCKPFFFLDLWLPGEHVDVNVHPTKREVAFLHQEALIEAVCRAVHDILLASNTTRTYTQTLLPGMLSADVAGPSTLKPQAATLKVTDNKLVRTDSRAQTLHAYMGPVSNSSRAAAAEAATTGAARRRGTVRPREALEADVFGAEADTTQRIVRQRKNPPPSQLTSICTLLAEIAAASHEGLTDVMKHHSFVGMASARWALLQHGTRLYLADIGVLSHDMMYQQALRRFECFERIAVQGSGSIAELTALALQAKQEQGHLQEQGETAEEVAALAQQLLVSKADMLRDYFSLDINSEGKLVSLPQLVDQWVPDLMRLPCLMLALARDVDWNDEKECFRSMATALAEFYMAQQPLCPGEQQCSSRLTARDACAAAAAQGASDELLACVPQPTTAPAAERDGNSAKLGSMGSLLGCSTWKSPSSGTAAAAPQYHSQAVDGGLDVASGSLTSQGVSAEGGVGGSGGEKPQNSAALAKFEWDVKHILLPAMRVFLEPSRQRATDGSVVELTRLEKLYKVFERC